MPEPSYLRLQALVFFLVAAAISNMYLTQPVLPVLQQEFGVSAPVASLTVSAVILGIALANLPFGWLADRYPVRLIILAGAAAVAVGGLIGALTRVFAMLVAARLLQGLFIPALTTCLAAYLSRTLPVDRLNVVMGSYVAATVAGGLGGRLLGGWLHPPLHWRYAFLTSAGLVAAAALMAWRWLPQEGGGGGAGEAGEGFLSLLARRELLGSFLAAASGMSVFAAVFNYLPFYLAGPPFLASTQTITLMYLTYITGIVVGPTAGQLSNRVGNGATMAGGAGIMALALLVTLIPAKAAVVLALVLMCTGFFALHAAAAGALNRKLTAGRGRGNSLYVLLYYAGGALGITASGFCYSGAGWPGVVGLGLATLAAPLAAGMRERRLEASGPE
jgi:YNFM family putative membrane transporter